MTESSEKKTVHLFEVDGKDWRPGLGRLATLVAPDRYVYDLAGLLLRQHARSTNGTLERCIEPWVEEDDGATNVIGFYGTPPDDRMAALRKFLLDVPLNIELMDMQDELHPGRCDFEQFLQTTNQLLQERGHGDVRFVEA